MKFCFVISPIGEEGSDTRKEADLVFNNIIRPATRRFRGELTVKRADHIASPGSITNEVIKMLRESEIVIADLTGWNPNVVYELAVRHFVNKPTILIMSTKESRKPFDLQNERIVRYDTTDLERGTRSTDALEAHIENCLCEEKDRVWSPSYLHDLVKSRDEKSDSSFIDGFRTAFAALHTEIGEVKETIGKINTQATENNFAYLLEKLSPEQIAATSTAMEHAAAQARDIAQGLGDLVSRLETASADTARAISAASDRLTSSLGFKADHASEDFAEIAQSLEDMLTARLDRISEGFAEKALATIDMMVGRSQELTDLVSGHSQELTDSIIETSSKVAERIAVNVEEVNSTLRASGDSMVLDLNLRGSELAGKLEQVGSRLADALASRSAKMADSVRESVEQLVPVITSHGDTLKDMLMIRLTEEISASMRAAAEEFSASLDRRLAHFEQISDGFTRLCFEMDKRMEAKVREVNNILDAQSGFLPRKR